MFIWIKEKMCVKEEVSSKEKHNEWLHLLVAFRRQLEARLAEKIKPVENDEFKIWHLPVLVNITEQGVTNKELIERLRLSKQALSKAQRELKRFGYITIDQGEDDKRTHLVLLTEKGTNLAKERRQWLGEVEQEYETVLGAEKTKVLKESLTALIRYNDKN